MVHRGLIKVKPDEKRAREHLLKAEHNLEATFYLHKGGYTDWCSSSLFYTIYHCFLGILIKFGYESGNQECTFACIASLIEDKRISLEEQDLEKVSSLRSTEVQEESTAVNIREEYQYSTKVSMQNKEYQELLSLAKK